MPFFCLLCVSSLNSHKSLFRNSYTCRGKISKMESMFMQATDGFGGKWIHEINSVPTPVNPYPVELNSIGPSPVNVTGMIIRVSPAPGGGHCCICAGVCWHINGPFYCSAHFPVLTPNIVVNPPVMCIPTDEGLNKRLSAIEEKLEILLNRQRRTQKKRTV